MPSEGLCVVGCDLILAASGSQWAGTSTLTVWLFPALEPRALSATATSSSGRWALRPAIRMGGLRLGGDAV